MAKKKYSEDVQNAYDAYGSEVQSAGQALAEGMTAAGQQQIADMEAANKAYNDANNAAIEANRQRSDAAIGSFADMVEGYAQNIRNAEAESAAQVAADQRAARWTGATELASSIANLIAVGGYNAVSQQYKPYSQDWMRKADMDARLNRARIDNLRERQRAMQGQLANMRMNDAARALELARADAKARYDQGLALSQARYNTTVNPLVQAGKTAEEVGKINAQGAAQAASVGLHERQLAQAAAHQAAQLAETKRYHDGQLAVQAAKAAKGSGGKDDSLPFKIRRNGKDETIQMNEKAYTHALKRGVPDLRKDLLAMVTKDNPDIKSWDDLAGMVEEKKVRDASGKKVRNPLYGSDLGEIVSIIKRDPSTYSEEDWEMVAGFAEGNYDQTENFNNHLYQTSKGISNVWGTVPDEDTEEAADESSEDGELNFNDKSQSEQTGMPTTADKQKKKDTTGLGNYQ